MTTFSPAQPRTSDRRAFCACLRLVTCRHAELERSLAANFASQRSAGAKNQFSTFSSDLSSSSNLLEYNIQRNNVTGPLPDPLPTTLTLFSVRHHFLALPALPD